MEYLMVRYGKITEWINEQAKAEFREDYDPSLIISKYLKRMEDDVELADDARFSWKWEQILQKTFVQMKKFSINKDECE